MYTTNIHNFSRSCHRTRTECIKAICTLQITQSMKYTVTEVIRKFKENNRKICRKINNIFQ